jgi:uncharacterized protein
VSAWRQPVLWLVCALPLASVVAGVATIRLAAAGPDVRGADAVRRTAQSQVEDLAPDLAATRARLVATLVVDRATGALELELDATHAPGALALRHPADAARDRTLALRRDGARWRAALGTPLAGAWRLELRGRDAAWRIDGRLARDASVARLAPRFAPPR